MEKNVIGRIGIIDRLLLKLSWLFPSSDVIIEEETTIEEKQLYGMSVQSTIHSPAPTIIKEKRPFKFSGRDLKILQIVQTFPNNNASSIGLMYRQAMGYKKYHRNSTGSDHSSKSLKRLLDAGKIKKNDKNQYSLVDL